MPEKPKITKIHLLVHPFYGVKNPREGWHVDPKKKPNYETYKPDLAIDYMRYKRYLARVWGQLVLKVANNPEEALIFVPLKWGIRRETRFLSFLEQRLSSFSQDRIPSRHFSVEDIDFKFAKNAVYQLNNKFNIDWNNVQLEAHGEMSDVCVRQFLERFALASGNKELLDQAIGILKKQDMKDSRVSIGQETTELARGKERYIVRHELLARKGTKKRLDQLAKFRTMIKRK